MRLNRVRISQINSWRIRSIHSAVEFHSVSYIVTMSACQISSISNFFRSSSPLQCAPHLKVCLPWFVILAAFSD